MRGTRLALSAATTLVLASGALAATPVAADEVSSGCEYVNNSIIGATLGEGPASFGADPGFATGEVLTFTFTEPVGTITSIDLRMLDPELVEALDPDPYVTVASTSTVPGTITYVIPAERAAPELVAFRIVVNGPGAVTVTGTCGPASPVVPAWLQAYGRGGEAAACATGWSPSWQQWAVPVTGGWVCTRSVPSLG
jgi:hypothetical protein